ncbi:hypothetical protein [Streptococcus oralis]|uniref:hypothetical protein n=1 Tax=Streptococcus oralis TaxID=1303 RepID=UPI001F3A0920|nr:hypothetical protein [Streptococcus oralis]
MILYGSVFRKNGSFEPVSIGFALNPEYPVFGAVATVLSTFWFFSACLVVSLPWAWFLSATTPAAILLLVVAAWLLSWVALDKASPSLLDAKLAAGLVSALSDADVEVETDACTSDPLVALVLSTSEVEA